MRESLYFICPPRPPAWSIGNKDKDRYDRRKAPGVPPGAGAKNADRTKPTAVPRPGLPMVF